MPPRNDDDNLDELFGPSVARQLRALDQIEDWVAPLRQAQALDQASAARAAGADLPQVMDEVCRINDTMSEALAPSWSARSAIEALDQQPDLSRAATDMLVDATTVMAETGVMSDLQVTDTLADLESPQERLQKLLGDVTRQFEELTRPLHLDPFQDRLRDMLEADHGARAAAQAVAPESVYQHLASVLEDIGLTPWFEELHRTMRQPDWRDLLEEQASASGLMNAELQSLLAEELLEQPDWWSLIESAIGSGRTQTDEPARSPVQEPKPPATTTWRLKRQFLEAFRKAVSRSGANVERLSSRLSLGLAAVGIVLTVNSQISSNSQHTEITREVRQNRDEIQALQHNRRWTLTRGQRLQLKASPISGTTDTRDWLGPLTLVESRSTGKWIEVTVHTCDGRKGTGWIRESSLEALEPTSEPNCPPAIELPIPQLVRDSGPGAQLAWQDFFLGKLPNSNTRQAYLRACSDFFEWCRARNLTLDRVRPAHVATWRDELSQDKSVSTVKQYLTAVRRLFDEWVIQQVVETNPAHPVRAPRMSRSRAHTPSLTAPEVVQLFQVFNNDSLVDLRDRAAIAIMTFSMARVSALCKLQVADAAIDRPEPFVALSDKGRQQHRLQIGGTVAEWIHAYVEAAGIGNDPRSTLIRSMGRGRGADVVSPRPVSRQDVYSMVRRRLHQAGIDGSGGCHSLRATGITLQLMRGAPIEVVSALAGHGSIDMTRRYDRRSWDEMQTALKQLA
jgi:site-specific recombinase XerD